MSSEFLNQNHKLHWFTVDELQPFVEHAESDCSRQSVLEAALALQQKLGNRLDTLAVRTIVRARETDYGEIELAGHAITCNTRFFWGASAAALVVLVMNPPVREELLKLAGNRPVDMLAADILNRAVMERELRQIRREIRDKVQEEGLKLGYGLRPGCQLIPLHVHSLVLELANAGKIGVYYDDTAEDGLQPPDAVINIIPMGINLAYSSENGNACDICGQGLRCANRRI